MDAHRELPPLADFDIKTQWILMDLIIKIRIMSLIWFEYQVCQIDLLSTINMLMYRVMMYKCNMFSIYEV